MERFNALSTGRKLILGAGVLLLIDTFFNWQAVGGFGQSGWHGFWGVLLGLMTIAIVAWVAARAFGVALPANVPDGLLTLGLGVLMLLFAFIKALSDSYTAWPAYVGIVLAGLVAIGGWLNFADSGEELPKFATSGAAAPAPPPASPPAPAALAAPSEPADPGGST
jgi:hypothetical protein